MINSEPREFLPQMLDVMQTVTSDELLLWYNSTHKRLA